jgi:crossover junction endodeoxyribonuclease RuvC
VLVECIDIPVVGTGAKERVDAAAIRTFIDRHKPAYALIERAGAMPGQGSSSGFKYGRAVGAIEAAIALCSIPMEIVEPSVWKVPAPTDQDQPRGSRGPVTRRGLGRSD